MTDHHATCECTLCLEDEADVLYTLPEPQPDYDQEIVHGADLTLALAIDGRSRQQILDDAHALVVLLATKLAALDVTEFSDSVADLLVTTAAEHLYEELEGIV